MPGTPDPVLGSNQLTFAVAATAGVLVALLPVYVRSDRFLDSKRFTLSEPKQFALGGGVAYAVLGLASWAGVRLIADAFEPSLFERPDALVALLLWSTAILVAQAGVPLYLYARWNLRTPLVGLSAVTTLVLYAFLRVRGESDPLALYSLFFGPMTIAGTAALGLVEAGVRRLVVPRFRRLLDSR